MDSVGKATEAMAHHATFVFGAHKNGGGFATISEPGGELINIIWRKIEAVPGSGNFSLFFFAGTAEGFGAFSGDTLLFFDDWKNWL